MQGLKKGLPMQALGAPKSLLLGQRLRCSNTAMLEATRNKTASAGVACCASIQMWLPEHANHMVSLTQKVTFHLFRQSITK